MASPSIKLTKTHASICSSHCRIHRDTEWESYLGPRVQEGRESESLVGPGAVHYSFAFLLHAVLLHCFPGYRLTVAKSGLALVGPRVVVKNYIGILDAPRVGSEPTPTNRPGMLAERIRGQNGKGSRRDPTSSACIEASPRPQDFVYSYWEAHITRRVSSIVAIDEEKKISYIGGPEG
ncbi:hypothetical protein ARMSODRAFT_975066 [Armillaria solidipes]|uniref:Uncharacterized protein n=1 Tax=Armillaria solidipes TaxID=1076256 RepID=A0A2H3BEL5_9AGAR|nr:hypothetical protein ARMSODRAFT_975066 [Armillaria solidipes]